MSSFDGALPVMHCHAPGSSSFDPSPKASSFCPCASLKVVRFGGGESQSRMRLPGPESSARFPSISKLPTEVAATAETAEASATRAEPKNRLQPRVERRDI